jgi:hypothetical protein
MGFLGDILEEGGSWLGRQAGKGIGKLLPFKRGTKKVKPVLMRRGGHLKKGSAAAKAYMAKIRAMKK